MPRNLARNLQRQAQEIIAQERLSTGSKLYRMWEDITSPYSGKVRTYFHYKGIPYRRMRTTFPTYMGRIPELVGMPIIPVILTPDNQVMQDSTPMMEWFEKEYPDRAVVPPDNRLAFLMWMVEDFADEYAPRWSMHYRWGNELSRDTIGYRIGRRFSYGLPDADIDTNAQMVIARQSGFDIHLGLTDATRADVEAQLIELLSILERHFVEYRFLFGDRPSMADFALYGHLYAHLFRDPLSMHVLETKAPQTCNWLEIITDFGDTRGEVGQTEFGAWVDFNRLPETLKDLTRFIGATYFPLAAATAAASINREKRFKATIRGIEAEFSTHHYRAWSFEQLQLRYEALPGEAKTAVKSLLEESGGWSAFMGDGIRHNGLLDGLTPPFVRDGIADNRVRRLKEKQG